MKSAKIALIEAAQHAKINASLSALEEELATIHTNPFMGGMELSQRALKQLLDGVYSIEYALMSHVNKTTWIPSDQLNKLTDEWYNRMNVVRVKGKPPFTSVLSFLRKYSNKTIKMVQVRYLLLKEACLPGYYKEYMYSVVPSSISVADGRSEASEIDT